MPRQARIDIRLSEAAKARYQAAADRDRRSLTSWIETRLDAAAERELEAPKKRSKKAT